MQMLRMLQFGQTWRAAFEDPVFLRRLRNPARAAAWAASSFYAPFLPVRTRLSCRDVLIAAAPLFAEAAEPEGGWPDFLLNEAVSLSYPNHARPAEPEQKDLALCGLLALQLLFREERRALLFDWHMDFSFLSEDDLADDVHAS